MVKLSNNTGMDSNVSDEEMVMAWFPIFVAVFMVVFLFVSFVLHHRRFRGRYKRKELLEYYLELHVEGGLKRIAAPTTSSSMRTHETNDHILPLPLRKQSTMVNLLARSSIDSAMSIAVTQNGKKIPTRKLKKAKKPAKVRHQDSGLLRLFLNSSKTVTESIDEHPVTISGSLPDSQNNLNVFISSPLPPISPIPSPSKKRKSSDQENNAPSGNNIRLFNTEVASDLDNSGAILLSAKQLPSLPSSQEAHWLERAQNEQTLV